MPNVKQKPSPQPWLQITWITKKNGRTNMAVLTIGFPIAAATTLVLGGVHLDFLKRVLKSAAVAFGLGP